MNDTSTLVLRHEPERHRFVATTEDGEGRLDYVVRDAKTLDFRHTFVPSEIRERGVAAKLVAFALKYAEDHGLGVVPTCSYVARYMEKHPEVQSIRRA
jgi:predicted GNAT family acetyltransferase